MNNLVRGIASWALILLIVIGSPGLLIAVGRYPGDGWLTLLRPDDGTVLLVAVTALGWLMWAWFTASILAEAAAQLSGRRLRVPGLALPRSLAAGLVVSALAITVGSTSALADVTDTQATHSSAPHANATTPESAEVTSLRPKQLPGTQGDALNSTRVVTEPIEADADGPQRAPGERSKDHTHVVEPGDDLWSLAQDYYGDGFAWRQIAKANPDRLTGGPDVLEPGWRLKIPGVDRAGQEPSETVRVQPGDTLSGLADEHLGSADLWPELYEANRASVDDPDEIFRGMVLRLPSQEEKKGASRSASTRDASSRRDTSSTRDPDPRSGVRQRDTESEMPAQPDPSSAATPPAEAPSRPEARPPVKTDAEPEASAPDESVDADRLLGLAGVGALLAAGLMTGIAIRRRLQLAERPLGRRIIGNSEQLARLETAIGRSQDRLTSTTLAAAQQGVYQHCRALDAPVPRLDRAEVSAEEIRFVFAEDPVLTPPPGFEATEAGWSLRHHVEPRPDTPSAYPGLVCLGSTRPGHHLFIDLATMPLLELVASSSLTTAVSTALMMELACCWWAGEVEVTLVGRPDDFVAAADLTSFGYVADPRRAIDGLLFRAAERREALTQQTLAESRELSPEAWRPQIYVFCGDIDADQLARLTELGDGAECAITAVVEGSVFGTGVSRLQVVEGSWPIAVSATLHRDGQHRDGLPRDGLPTAAPRFEPQLIDEPLRRSIVELFEATHPQATEDAPWWVGAKHLHSDGPVLPTASTPPVEARVRPHLVQCAQPEGDTEPARPQVRLLGPLQLAHAAGQAPTRAQRQCIEYCAWLLEHPGASARQMADALFVAETTRRSNMSRLRTWLGEDAAGRPYLPDAYSGRIRLAAEVDSDWRAFQRLVVAGIPRTKDSALVAALELVRGAPLADAAPGQWHWAEGLRTDIVSAVRDAAVVLARRAVDAGDIELARWSTARGLAAAPQDEILLAARVETEYRAGNRPEVDRLAARITDRARELDVSLHDETVLLLQSVLEGAPRERRIRA